LWAKIFQVGSVSLSKSFHVAHSFEENYNQATSNMYQKGFSEIQFDIQKKGLGSRKKDQVVRICTAGTERVNKNMYQTTKSFGGQSIAACYVKICHEQTESVARLLDGLGWELPETRRIHECLR
jgi:diphthamide synthase subunit DPH2